MSKKTILILHIVRKAGHIGVTILILNLKLTEIHDNLLELWNLFAISGEHYLN